MWRRRLARAQADEAHVRLLAVEQELSKDALARRPFDVLDTSRLHDPKSSHLRWPSVKVARFGCGSSRSVRTPYSGRGPNQPDRNRHSPATRTTKRVDAAGESAPASHPHQPGVGGYHRVLARAVSHRRFCFRSSAERQHARADPGARPSASARVRGALHHGRRRPALPRFHSSRLDRPWLVSIGGLALAAGLLVRR